MPIERTSLWGCGSLNGKCVDIGMKCVYDDDYSNRAFIVYDSQIHWHL